LTSTIVAWPLSSMTTSGCRKKMRL